MTEQRPTRTIYRSAAGAARSAPAAAPPAKGRRRLRDAWWLAPVLALLVLFLAFFVAGFFLLGGVGLLQYVGITAAGKSFAGTWGSSDPALGERRAHRQGGRRLLARAACACWANPSRRCGRTTTSSWRAARGRRVVAALACRSPTATSSARWSTYGDGRPPLETLLTRQ